MSRIRLLAVILLVCIKTSFACTGNCIMCHPVLKKSIEKPHHRILKSCIKCHQDNVGYGVSSCGQDCFECHSKEKLIASSRPEHQAIWECSMCHKDNNKVIFR